MKHANAGIDAALRDIAEPTTKHTPGPWLIREDAGQINIADPTRNWDMCNITMRHAPTIEQARANARLIAAAPDLLAALNSIIAAVDWMNEHALPAQAKAINSTFDWQAARAALAKASAA